MAVSWTNIENTIAAWIRAGTGLATGQVIWAKQSEPRPSKPYVSVDVIGVNEFGQDWVDIEDTDGAPEGEEITHKARGPRELVLSIQCFAESSLGDSGAVQLLERLRGSLKLPTVRETLRNGSVGVASFSGVQALGGVLNSSIFEPRATLTARAFVTSEVEETGTYIETVELENDPPWS